MVGRRISSLFEWSLFRGHINFRAGIITSLLSKREWRHRTSAWKLGEPTKLLAAKMDRETNKLTQETHREIWHKTYITQIFITMFFFKDYPSDPTKTTFWMLGDTKKKQNPRTVHAIARMLRNNMPALSRRRQEPPRCSKGRIVWLGSTDLPAQPGCQWQIEVLGIP